MKSGLERVAEELMGRRKWKHYQDVLTRQPLNLLDPSTNATVADEVDVELLQSAAAAVVASSVASNAVPPSLVAAAAAVGGNFVDQKGGGAAATAAIVRNGHYQQEGELATSNNQQVAAAATAVEHPDHAASATATAAGKHPNHINENDTRSSTAAAATTANPTSHSPPAPPHPTATPVTALLNNHHHQHHHPHHSQHQRGGPHHDGSSPSPGGVVVDANVDQQQQQQQRHQSEQEEDGGGRIGNSVSSPASTTTTATATTTGLLSPAAGSNNEQELVGKLTGIKQEPTENQNNSSATPEQQQQQSKLIKQENCNNLLNSKIIINNNNSATNNNNNNNNISSGSGTAGETDGTNAATLDGENSSKQQRHQHHQHHHQHHHQNHPSQPPTPVDWKPQDKCYFCVDGKLLTVNEAGELVPESGHPTHVGGGGSVGSQRVVPKTEVLNDSDCESSDSSESDLRAAIAAGRAGGLPGSKSLAALLRSTSSGPSAGVSPTMASLQTMASQFAAMASLPPGLAQLYNPLWYSQLQQQMSPSGASGSTGTDATTAAASSPTEKSGEPGAPVVVGPGGEQPLDLSAKPGSSGLGAALNAGQLMMSMIDPKNIYKAKPRLSPIGGRRTYTEDELQSALQDILNGKLGTRRAAVQYGIPRSTLRNKVYKLAMEYKRDVLHHVPLDDDDDDDKDSLEDDVGIGAGGGSSNQIKYNQQALAEAYLRLYGGGGSSSSTPKPEPTSAPSTPPQQHPTPEPPSLKPIHPQTPQPQQQQTATPQSSPLAAAANSLIDPNILLQLQSLLLTGALPRLTNQAAQTGNPEEAAAAQAALATLPELLKKLIQQQELIAEQIKKAAGGPEPQRPSASTPTLNNGQPIDPRLFPYLQQSKSRAASGTPETTTSSMDLNDGGSDDSQVILKVPSYKPVPNQSPLPTTAAAAALLAASKNGDHHNLSTPSPPTNSVPSVRDLSSLVVGGPGSSLNSNSTPRPVHTASPQQPSSAQPLNHLSVISPPMSGGIRPRSNSQSPPSLLGGKSMLSINDVIARSISKNFQQHHQSDLMKQQMESMEQQYKRPTISVIKNLGGTDISRFGTNPNITQMTAQQLANTGTGGKGTRPKRGKYRNYDRDSLVEAVKAVQRGEMSVHRAGSYYGVPHSTLEYKVKERHLMRPRKREPKPQPGLDGLKSDLGGGGGSSSMRSMDKNKGLGGMGASAKSQQMKNQYAGASPNGGLKMPMFDPGMASQLPYSPPFLWPHPTAGFTGLPMDFGRQAGAAGSSSASAIMQRFQPDQQGSKLPGAVSNNSAGGPKTARELAESIYDGTSTNGSFLDDIIRHSLDKKPGDMHHGALFDQLMKSNRSVQPPSQSSGSADDSATAALLAKVSGSKRSATSPLNFLPEMIKRERTSPGASSTSSTSSKLGSVSFNDHHLQQQQQRHLNTSSESLFESQLAKNNLAVENLIKLREDLTSMSAAHHHNRTSMEDQHNGGKDELSSSVSEQLQQQHQLLSQRLVTKLPTDDGSS